MSTNLSSNLAKNQKLDFRFDQMLNKQIAWAVGAGLATYRA